MRVIAAVVWSPEEYPSTLRQIWEDSMVLMEHNGEPIPQIYAGSIKDECATCHVTVAVGPRQQAAMSDWNAYCIPFEVHCLICAVRRVGAEREGTALIDLNNPEFTDD